MLETEKPTPLAALEHTMAHGAEAVEAEYGRSQNTWMDCWGTQVTILDMSTQFCRQNGLLPAEKLDDYEQKISYLKLRFRQLKEQYSTREAKPPEELKQELKDLLDISR